MFDADFPARFRCASLIQALGGWRAPPTGWAAGASAVADSAAQQTTTIATPARTLLGRVGRWVWVDIWEGVSLEAPPAVREADYRKNVNIWDDPRQIRLSSYTPSYSASSLVLCFSQV